MRCENCNAELAPTNIVCPNCGAPVAKDVEGFENTAAIRREMKRIVDENGKDILKKKNSGKLVAFLNDYIPEYEKERKLLRRMINDGVLARLQVEKNEKTALMQARSYMHNELFLDENAADFVLVCFAYMLGWSYQPLNEKKAAEPAEKDESRKKSEKAAPVNINARVFRPVDAARSRFKGNIVIPEGYTRIDSFCFDGFSFMRTIELPSTLAAISEYAFSECKRLRGVELPESLKIIRQGAFSQCAKLTIVKIPKGILEIEDNTFQFCRGLEVIDVPPTVSSIGNGAFAGCESLRKLFLPESVKFIDDNAFAYCPQLTIRCYENSYVHKYCIANGIKTDLVARGTAFKS
ncbi:MAG: leucine-rich repeat protein [Ruminococcus sp.]|nr:leucine-rich repeat protein [Ruminococcus sp.]